MPTPPQARTPIVTVLDQDKRSSSPVALAPPVVVQAFTVVNLNLAVQSAPVTINTTTIELSNTVTTINGLPASAWANSQPITVTASLGAGNIATQDLNVIRPMSPSATINVSGGGTLSSPIQSLMDGTGDLPDWLNTTKTVVTAIAGIIVTAGAIVAFAPAAPLALIIPVIAASPGLEVDQGTVTVSNFMFYGVTDSPPIVVKGGTLILENDLIFGTPRGSRPLIEVDGGTLILGGPNGTNGASLLSFGSEPYISVSGGGKVIDNGGNGYAQAASDGNLMASGTTDVQLVSGAPVAVPGQVVTFTATVTASGALAGDGSVDFVDETTSTDLGTAPVNDGSAVLPVTFDAFTTGDTIVATYVPTSGALRPSSGHVTQAVVAATTTTVTGPNTTPIFGQSVTFTATVTDTTESGGTPTGSVEFFDGSTDLGPGTALSGSGNVANSTFTTASLAPGPHTIRAVYTPTGAFQAGADSLDLTVAPRQVEQVAVGFGTESSIVSPNVSRTLPWADFASVQITFNGGASGLTASDFTLVGARFGNYLAGSTFVVDAATQTITLTFAASSVVGSNGWFSTMGKGGDRLTLGVDGVTIQTFSVLPGDYDGNGVVNLLDLDAVRSAAKPGQPYDIFADLNGDGLVDAADVALAVKFAGSKLNLPAGPLSLASTSAAPPIVAAIDTAAAVGAPPTPGQSGTNRTDGARPAAMRPASWWTCRPPPRYLRRPSRISPRSSLPTATEDGFADAAESALSLKGAGAAGPLRDRQTCDPE